MVIVYKRVALISAMFFQLAYGCLMAQEVQSDSLSPENISINLLKEVDNALAKAKGKELKKIVVNLRSDITRTTISISKAPATIDSFFYIFLNNDLQVLRSIDFEADSSSSLSKLAYLSKRFHLLSKNIPLNGLGDTPYFGVEVTIRVTKKNKDILGYQVGFSTLFWYNSKHLKYTNDNKSPTIIELPPGDYIYYLMKNNQIIKSSKVTIGNSKGDTQQTIHIELDN